MRRTAKAPAKVTLFGEHAVVYGHPALVMAIPIHVTAVAEFSEDFSLESGPVILKHLALAISEGEVKVIGRTRDEVLRYFSYILEALKVLNVEKVKVSLSSPLPVGAGLGTSAAVTVSTIAAVSALLNRHMDREEIANLAWEVEKRVQGRASPMDTSASALGGVLLIGKEADGWYRKRVRAADVPLVIGLFRKRKSTAELVSGVAELITRHPFASTIMKTIGELTERAVESLEKGDLALLGELMNINHGLLEALGIVTKEVANAVHSARLAGALGAKVSGAGGGGAVIAVGDDVDEIAAALKASGAERVFVVKGAARGVHVE